jgi:hypothetical protein
LVTAGPLAPPVQAASLIEPNHPEMTDSLVEPDIHQAKGTRRDH